MKEIKTKGNTLETGKLNELVEHTVSVILGERNLGLKLDTGKVLVIDTEKSIVSKRSSFTDRKIEGTTREIKGRPSISLDVSPEQTSFAVGTLVAIVKDLAERDGVKRDTYIGLEGNHMDSTGSGRFGDVNNSIENMELVDKNANSRHNCVQNKLIKLGIWIRFSAKDKEFMDWVLKRGFIMRQDISHLEVKLSRMYDTKTYILRREDENSPYEIIN